MLDTAGELYWIGLGFVGAFLPGGSMPAWDSCRSFPPNQLGVGELRLTVVYEYIWDVGNWSEFVLTGTGNKGPTVVA
jgi:hypothetical protein